MSLFDISIVRPTRRTGLSAIWTLLAIVTVVVGLTGSGIYVYGIPGLGESADDGVDVRVVKRGQFIHRVTETGEIESSENVEIRCEVKARGTQGTPILEVVPEGTMVSEGDILVKLDSTAFENELTSHEMATNKAKAAKIAAQKVLQTAQFAKKEYLKGTYIQEQLRIEGEQFVAKQNWERALQYLEYSKKLATKGYVTPLQLKADQYAVDKAIKDLAAADNKLKVLNEYTLEKKETELNNDILTAEARLEAETSGYELELSKLEDVKTQIEKCTVRAPAAGQVVHANQRSRRGGSDVVIEPGVLIRQNQVMIRLPNPSMMQVKAKINEARVDLVKPGMEATITVGAFPDMQLAGHVDKVNRYAEPGSWFSTNVKTYATFIRIEGNDDKLRPGLTAEVQIEVARLEDVLMLPITCVTEHGGKHYCMVRRDDKWEPQPRVLVLGPSNETHVVIESGVDEDEVVAANPQRHRQHARWPKIKIEDESVPAPKKEKPKSAAGGMVAKFMERDANGDGKLSEGEVSTEVWGFIARFDRDGDKAVSRAEIKAGAAAMKGAGGAPGGSGATP